MKGSMDNSPKVLYPGRIKSAGDARSMWDELHAQTAEVIFFQDSNRGLEKPKPLSDFQ